MSQKTSVTAKVQTGGDRGQCRHHHRPERGHLQQSTISHKKSLRISLRRPISFLFQFEDFFGIAAGDGVFLFVAEVGFVQEEADGLVQDEGVVLRPDDMVRAKELDEIVQLHFGSDAGGRVPDVILVVLGDRFLQPGQFLVEHMSIRSR